MEKSKSALPVMISIYTLVWSLISLLRYYSFNAGVFDLGVAMGYITYSTEGLTLSKLVQIFMLKPIVYLVAPVAYAFGFQGLLVFQSFFLALGAYPIYMIAFEKLKNNKVAILLAASYLLYFPLAGLNWFDFHYQALFPTLFLLGYWFYLKGRQVFSLIFMLLSGMVHYPYTVFPLLFAFILIIGKDRKRDLKIWAPLLIVTLLIFVMNVVTHGIYGASLGTVATTLVKPNDFDVFITVILILLPLLFAPIFSKWIVFLTPFLALIIYSRYWGYFYPNLFKLQYGALFIPFVFLGTVDGVLWLEKNKIVNRKRSVGTIFILIMLFALAYQPYSPLNSYTAVNYDIAKIFNVNFIEYNQLMKLLSLIPAGSSVLVANNVPEVYSPYFHLQPYDNIYTAPELVQNGTIEYIVAGPYGMYYSFVPAKPAVPMDELVENVSQSGKFGIYAEAYGILLLKYNYTGPLKYYYPLSIYLSSSNFLPSEPWFIKNQIIVVSGTNEPAWSSPDVFLPPGNYEMIIFMKSTSNVSSNEFVVSIMADDLTKLLYIYDISGSSLKPGWNSVTVTFSIQKVYKNIVITGYINKWQGNLMFKGIYINQTSY